MIDGVEGEVKKEEIRKTTRTNIWEIWKLVSSMRNSEPPSLGVEEEDAEV